MPSNNPSPSAEAIDAALCVKFNPAKVDLKEAKTQIFLALPLIFINASCCLVTMISVIFAGHQSSIDLAGATLANSWAYVTGFVLTSGLTGALETLCGQTFGGSENHEAMGLYLQASSLITMAASVIISVIWLFTEPILVFMKQDHSISKKAAEYMKYLIPGIYAFGLLQNILRFLQTQSAVKVLIVLSVFMLGINVVLCVLLVNVAGLGFVGAPLAVSLTFIVSASILAIYVMSSNKFQHTWTGFSLNCAYHIIKTLGLALPSAGMTCLEFWAFEILVLLAGLMPSPQVTTSVMAISATTEDVCFMISSGLSAAVSTRVSNEIGANNKERAKGAMVVGFQLVIVDVLILSFALALGRYAWVGLFSPTHEIKEAFSSLVPLVIVAISLDSLQGVMSGVARGSGWQSFAFWANLVTFYGIGLPISIVLGFKLKLYTKGLWIGLSCGLICQLFTLSVISTFMKSTLNVLSFALTTKMIPSVRLFVFCLEPQT